MTKNIAIILASGSSERLSNLKTVKQFTKIAGKMVIEHTLDVFEKNKTINEIIIVTKDEYKPICYDLADKNNYKKISKILTGGKTRQESSRIAIMAAKADDNDNILIHDAVRPFISDKIIDDCINALENYSAVDVAIPSADTIIQVNNGNLIENIPKRKYLRRGQTPQAFKYGIIKKAHVLAQNDTNLEVTDDCGLIKYFNLCDVFVVDGDDYNIKITYPIDIDIADKLFQIRNFDIPKTELEKLKDKVIVVFGASRGIGKDIVAIAQGYGAKVFGYSRENNVNVVNFTDVKNALKFVYEKEKNIDCVINTAGILSMGKIENRDINDIIRDVNVNYIGSINVLKAAIPYLKQTQGSFLLFASSSYTRGRANFAIYSSTKAALVNLTHAVAEEHQKDNITINIINPERTATPMRFENFGTEPEGTLLNSKTVAIACLLTILSNLSGQVINVTRDKEAALLKYIK